MTETFLFVGGGMDGRRIVVRDGTREVHIPVMDKEKEIYCRRGICAPPRMYPRYVGGKEYPIYLISTESPDNLIPLLIEGYRTPKEARLVTVTKCGGPKSVNGKCSADTCYGCDWGGTGGKNEPNGKSTYTVKEIDDLRHACERRWLYGTTVCYPRQLSRQYGEVEKTKIVEELVRTYMLAGITGDNIRQADKARP